MDAGLDLVSRYGESIADYGGSGTLTLVDGQTIECSFQAAQLRDGRVVLICVGPGVPFNPFERISPSRFDGTTTEGVAVTVEGDLFETSFLGDIRVDETGFGVAFWARSLTASYPARDREAAQFRFGIRCWGREGRAVAVGEEASVLTRRARGA